MSVEAATVRFGLVTLRVWGDGSVCLEVRDGWFSDGVRCFPLEAVQVRELVRTIEEVCDVG